MANKVNQSQNYRIYLKSTKEWVEVTKEFFTDFYRDINAYRKRQQEHGRCVCPASKRYLCDMDCYTCPYAKAGDTISLDYDSENEDGDVCSLLDSIPDTAPLMERVVEDSILLEQLLECLLQLDPDGKLIFEMLSDQKSDRAIAEALGRSQRTFARQMKRYRAELRKVRGY